MSKLLDVFSPVTFVLSLRLRMLDLVVVASVTVGMLVRRTIRLAVVIDGKRRVETRRRTHSSNTVCSLFKQLRVCLELLQDVLDLLDAQMELNGRIPDPVGDTQLPKWSEYNFVTKDRV